MVRAKKKPVMTSGPKKLAFGYVRVSTDRQANEGVSLDAQREQIRSRCAYNGYDLSDLFVDAGVSGKRSGNRPGLQKAIAAACDVGGALIVFSLSRLARSTIDAITISRKLEKAHATLVSLKEDFDTSTGAGKLFFTIMAALAEFESDAISERTRMALDHLRHQGMRLGGSIPFGFDLGSDGKSLVKNPIEWAARERILKLRKEKVSLRAIAEQLNADKIRSKGGKPWGASSIQSILASHAKSEEEK
jgi:DNA invertase Pin-like site-specific DNA recombinase